MKKLETEIVPSEIYCDVHKEEPVLYFNEADGKLQCKECRI